MEGNSGISMDKMHTDLLIIGGGTGGYVAGIYASRCGKNVTLIEKNKLGGLYGRPRYGIPVAGSPGRSFRGRYHLHRPFHVERARGDLQFHPV